jgi:hypothetical protein
MERLPNPEQEIDRRTGDGLDIRFVWNHVIEAAYTRVTDERSGETFTAHTEPGVHPYESFLHPFVYRVEPGDGTLS